MKYSNIHKAIKEQLTQAKQHPSHHPKVTHYIQGAPGGGKSALAAAIGKDPELNYSTTTQFFASLRDPVDLLGLPRFDDTTDTARWRIPHELAHLRQGKHLLVIEELSDSTTPMQNALCGLIYDRKVGELTLSPEVDIIATGNRTKDKSGANRLVSKLTGRVRMFNFEENLDDWVDWALKPVGSSLESDDEEGGKTPITRINPQIVAFLRFRPDLLSAFDPDLPSPTPRTWERANAAPLSLLNISKSLYLETVAGDIGVPCATEFVAFLDICGNLPEFKAILANPTGTAIPADLSAQYALVGSLAHKAKKIYFEKLLTYVSRMPAEFGVMFVKDTLRFYPSVSQTDTFTAWAGKNQEILGLV